MIPGGFFNLNAFMLSAAVLLSLLAGLFSGVYPAWKACRIAPAMQLKVQ
jgi:putative ABC transport system permease protein